LINERVSLPSPARKRGRPATSLQSVSLPTIVVAARHVGVFLLLGFSAAASVLYGLHLHAIGGMAFDFSGTIWHPLHDALRGLNPYPAPRIDAVDIGNPSTYPPLGFLLAAPLAPLPYSVAAALWTVLLVAAVPAGLYIAGSRDWRCYAVALTSFPIVHGVTFGNATLLLVPLAAAAWTLRRREVLSGFVVGAAVALKVFLWPLALWLLATRRIRGAAAAGVSASLLLLASWATIGFEGMREYPRLLKALTTVFASHGVSPAALPLGLGASVAAATLIGLGFAALLGALCVYVARRPSGEAASFTLAIAVALVASPIVWPLYYALLVVPAAILRPRFDRVWLLFPLTWVIALFVPKGHPGPGGGPAEVPDQVWRYLHGSTPTWWIVGYLAILGGITGVALHDRRRLELSR
jgi:hypothetical protein